MLILAPELQRRARIFHRVMRPRLDLFVEQVPGEKAEAQTALARTDEEEVDRVDDLRAGDMDGDGAEIFR